MTPMYLTDEQRSALEVEERRGQPLDVIDPQTQRTYVLMPREQFDRMRAQLSGSVPDQGGEMPAGETGSAPVGARLEVQLPLKLRDLPTPCEVSEETKRYCRRLGLRKLRYRQDIEDELKMQYYFGGRYVGYFSTDDGPMIVAAGKLNSELFGRQLDSVEPQRRRDVILDVPSAWNDSVSKILTPNV